VVRGWDPRSGSRLWRLRGHTENVRALMLSEDGTLCISGSADRTIRVWDVGMRRCVHVFDAHHDSVWALGVAGCSCGWSNQAGADAAGAGGVLSEVFSGGRDGLVLAHDLRLLQTGLVVREPSPIQALAVSSDTKEIWAPAADSHVRRHIVPTNLVPYDASSGSVVDAVPHPGAAHSPMPGLPPPAGDDSIAIQGTPRLIDYKVLHNKRQVLVRDMMDQLSLWDVTNGQCIDFAMPAAPPSGAATEPGKEDDVMKRALAQVNKPVSVPNWFSCDLSLGSLTVYLDASHCFKAETEDAHAIIPALATGTSSGGRNGQLRAPDASASPALVNFGTRTLRALFESWVRLPQSTAANQALATAQASRSGGLTPNTQRLSVPRIFVAMPEQSSGGEAQRWDDDQPPGTPTDDANPTTPEVPSGGSSASHSSFPPATAIILVGRNGRAAGYRGRLYCSLFNGTEVADLMPPWVVDVVWNQRPPSEELCGERNLLFTLTRCPSEIALPALPLPYCVAAPRTVVRRMMAHLVRALDFDWAAPAKAAARRQGGAVSLVSRLGRCCTGPASRARAPSGDWSDGGGNSARRSGSSSRERIAASGGNQVGNAGQRRSFGLRRGDEEGGGPSTAAGRIRIDGSPAPMPSMPAQTTGRRSGSRSPSGGAVPDERFVEILCNDVLVDPDISLATVRDFIWRKPGQELVLTYRRAKHISTPTSPTPPPPLLQGGQSASNPSSPAGAVSTPLNQDVTPELNGPDSNPSPARAINGTPERIVGGPPRQ
jgi:hypothetical protein